MAVLGFIGRLLLIAAGIYVVVYAFCLMAYSTWSGYRYIKRPDRVAAVMTPLLLLSIFLTGYTNLPLIYSFIVVVILIAALTFGYFWITVKWQDWQRSRKR
jgi:hypothetical protein